MKYVLIWHGYTWWGSRQGVGLPCDKFEVREDGTIVVTKDNEIVYTASKGVWTEAYYTTEAEAAKYIQK